MRLCVCHYRIFYSGDARRGYKQMRNMPVIAALFARETQNLASLLG